MKICIVCPRLCHGGAERVAVCLANGFKGKGYQVTFLTDLYEEQTYVLNSAVVIKNMVARPHPKMIKWLGAIFILRKWLKKERPDVIIGIMSLCSLIAWIASVGLKIPVIATDHDSYEKPLSAPMSLWGRIFKFHLCKLFQCVTVLTEADKKVINGRLKNVEVMPNPLAVEPVVDVPPKKKIVLAAGRVDNWYVKGFDLLIKAWGSLMKNEKFRMKNSEWRLQIAGVWRSQKTKDYLDSIAKEYGVFDNIDYLGFVEDMKSLYQEASVFVLSSRYEGFGLVLIEAMSQGCACVACDYKGRQSEIITSEEEGLLCEIDNVDVLAKAIKETMEDEQYRKMVQKNAIIRSNYYDMNNTMERWEELLRRVCIS